MSFMSHMRQTNVIIYNAVSYMPIVDVYKYRNNKREVDGIKPL